MIPRYEYGNLTRLWAVLAGWPLRTSLVFSKVFSVRRAYCNVGFVMYR
jgi:hypothetical protein